MTTWKVLTRNGEVKFGMLPSWPAPKYFGLQAAWKDEALNDFIQLGLWRTK